jgi:hypothetical protein
LAGILLKEYTEHGGLVGGIIYTIDLLRANNKKRFNRSTPASNIDMSRPLQITGILYD